MTVAAENQESDVQSAQPMYTLEQVKSLLQMERNRIDQERNVQQQPVVGLEHM